MAPLLNILTKLPPMALVLMAALSVILGDLFAKTWSVNQRISYWGLAMLFYFGSGFFYTPALLKEGLIYTGIIWLLVSTIGFLFVGLFLFKETLSPWQVVGVALGLASLAILAIAD